MQMFVSIKKKYICGKCFLGDIKLLVLNKTNYTIDT